MNVAVTAPVIPLFASVSGSVTPRIATKRPPGRSEGAKLIRFASEVLDLEPLAWQQWVLRRGLVKQGGRWQSRTVSVLVARQSGKTTLATIRALGGMVLWGEQVVGAAQNRDIALEAWREALTVAEDAGLVHRRPVMTNGREEFWIGRSRYKVASSTRRGGRGLRADLVVLDEVREFRDEDGWAALEKTRRARPSSQLWAISTEGDDGSEVLNRLSREGRAAAASGDLTDSAWFEWSADPELPRDSPVAWAQANPELGGLISFDTIASEALHDAPEVFETEVLCRRVTTLRPWLPAGSWDATADAQATVPDGSQVVFSLDAGPELRHATIAVGYQRPGQPWGDGRVFVEAVAGYSDADGPVLARAETRLAELCQRWQPPAVVALKGSAAAAAAQRALTDLEAVPFKAVGSTDQAAAATGFYEAVRSKKLVHPPDPMTAAHIGAVTADGLFTRRSHAADIDAAIAVTLAHHATVHLPRPPTWAAY